MIAKNHKKIKRVKYNLFFLLILLLVAIVSQFSLLFIKYNKKYKDQILQNVFIDNINFSGKTKDYIKNYYQDASLKLLPLIFTIKLDNEIIATFSAQSINIRYDGETASERAYLVGRSKYELSSFYQRLISFLKLNKFRFSSLLIYDNSPIKDFLSLSEEKYNRGAKNALFKFENGKVVNFRKEELGFELESEKFIKEFDVAIQSLKSNPSNKEIVLNKKIIKPEITLASSNSFGIEEEIAVGVSNFSHSIPERIHNVILASSKFNGVLIPKNKQFSFNETIGDISSYTGYKPAYIIKEGKTVLGDGGGVCQVSTTLFRAALNAGLPIVERHAHAYRVSYYENDSHPGFDATVFSPSVDLKIVNNTSSYILIQTEIDEENNLLYFHLYGKKDDRKVEIDNIFLWDVSSPPPPRYQDDPTLKKGLTKQVDFPAWGGKASFTYKVYKDNQLIIDEKFYSIYKPWASVFLVGTAD